MAAPAGTNWPAVKHGVFAFTALELHCLWTAAMGVATYSYVALTAYLVLLLGVKAVTICLTPQEEPAP